MAKIDYDKPVNVDRPKLAEGWYWAINPEHTGPTFDPCYVWKDQSTRLHSPGEDGSSETVGILAGAGWQFYPARLPRVRRGK
jgi:hypothetical protein